MSGAPQFPDPLGTREVYRPGATVHKAGPDVTRKVLALEQGALGRPGPGVANGCVITSDTSQTGGVKWAMPGSSAPITIVFAGGHLTADAAAGSYVMPPTGTWVNGAADHRAIDYIPLDPADHAVTGRTCQIRIQGMITTNDTAPTGTFIFNLTQVTGLSGGVDATYATAASQKMAATTISTPAAQTFSKASSSWTDFTVANFPAGGYYLRCNTSGTLANNALVKGFLALEKRYV